MIEFQKRKKKNAIRKLDYLFKHDDIIYLLVLNSA